MFNLTFPSHLFKPNFKSDGKFNAKGIQNNGTWNHTANGYWENKPFLNLLNFFDFHLLNGSIVVKAVNAIRKLPQSFPKSSLQICSYITNCSNSFGNQERLRHNSKKALEIYLFFLNNIVLIHRALFCLKNTTKKNETHTFQKCVQRLLIFS